LIDHKHYICEHGDDMPEIAGWRWGQQATTGGPRVADTGADNV
jgi:xylulose-5-phosphate/fructose-6-phosphate phosphoketolase